MTVSPVTEDETAKAHSPEPIEDPTSDQVRKGRLVFRFPSSDKETALFYPSVCVCTAPCEGHCSCGIGCWAIHADVTPSQPPSA